MLFKRGVFKNFTNFIESVLEYLFNKVTGLKIYKVIKKRLQHRCIPVKFATFLRKPFFTEHLWWLLLNKPKRSL